MTIAKDSSSNSQPVTPTIEGITEPTVVRYFETFNDCNWEATAALFAADGKMYPPFETPVEGPEAIATYLQAQAEGMKLFPCQEMIEPLEGDRSQVHVSGKVQTSWCGINVSWLFVLNSQGEIICATIKLLASPQELLNLRR